MNILCRNKETVCGGVFFLFGAYLLWEVGKFVAPPETVRSLGPDVFPGVLSWSLCALSLVLFIQGLRLPPAPIIPEKLRGGAAYAPAAVFGGCLSFMLFIESLGFLLWSILFLALLQYALGERRIPINLGFAIVFSLGVYLIFGFGLSVPMPRGPLPL